MLLCAYWSSACFVVVCLQNSGIWICMLKMYILLLIHLASACDCMYTTFIYIHILAQCSQAPLLPFFPLALYPRSQGLGLIHDPALNLNIYYLYFASTTDPKNCCIDVNWDTNNRSVTVKRWFSFNRLEAGSLRLKTTTPPSGSCVDISIFSPAWEVQYVCTQCMSTHALQYEGDGSWVIQRVYATQMWRGPSVSASRLCKLLSLCIHFGRFLQSVCLCVHMHGAGWHSFQHRNSLPMIFSPFVCEE